MRTALRSAAACAVLVACSGVATAAPDVDSMRVIVHMSGVKGTMRGACVAIKAPATDSQHDLYVLAVEAATTYGPPGLIADCWLRDLSTGIDYYPQVGPVSALVVAAGAGVVSLPQSARPWLCLRLTAGGRAAEQCGVERIIG